MKAAIIDYMISVMVIFLLLLAFYLMTAVPPEHYPYDPDLTPIPVVKR